jgi:hypothetical protein
MAIKIVVLEEKVSGVIYLREEPKVNHPFEPFMYEVRHIQTGTSTTSTVWTLSKGQFTLLLASWTAAARNDWVFTQIPLTNPKITVRRLIFKGA